MPFNTEHCCSFDTDDTKGVFRLETISHVTNAYNLRPQTERTGHDMTLGMVVLLYIYHADMSVSRTWAINGRPNNRYMPLENRGSYFRFLAKHCLIEMDSGVHPAHAHVSIHRVSSTRRLRGFSLE